MYLSAANTVAWASNTTLRASVNSTGNWVLAAPSSGTTLALTPVAGGVSLTAGKTTFQDDNGFSATAANVYSSSTNKFAFGTTGAADSSWWTNSTQRVVANSTGNVTINAPSSGTALTVTGGAATIATFQGAAAVNADVIINTNGSTAQYVLSSRISGGAFVIRDGVASADRISLSQTGNVTINAPSSSNALSIASLNATNAVQLSSTTGAAGSFGIGFNAGITTNAWNLYSTSTDPFALGTQGAATVFINTNGLPRMSFSSTGAATINNPTSGVALTISGGGLSVTGTSTLATTTVSGTSGVSFTVNATSGTHSTQIADSANTKYNAGYLELPVNNAGATYTAVLADSGKELYYNGTGATTYTIPANGSVAYPVGTTLTFCNDATGATNMTIAITTDTLVLTPGGSTGSRTLAQYGRATAHKVTATRWFISGTGLS